MQIQLTTVQNGWLVASPPDMSKVNVRNHSPEQLQQMAQTPEITFCEDYDAVCVHLKRFFFSPAKN